MCLKYSCAVPAALGIMATGLHANLILNDSFNYGGSNLETGYGAWEDGTGNLDYFSSTGATWTGDSDYVASNEGGHLNIRTSAAAGRGGQIDLGQSLTGEFWLSVRINNGYASGSDTTAPFSSLLVAFEDGDYAFDDFAYGIGPNFNDTLAQSVADGAPSELSGVTPTQGTWGLYILQVNVNAVGDDSISVWVFDDDAADIGDGTVAGLGAATFSSSTISLGASVGDVWLGGIGGGVGTSGGFDDLRLSDLSGNSGLQEVLTGVASIPEPSTYAALAGVLSFGMVTMLRRRARS